MGGAQGVVERTAGLINQLFGLQTHLGTFGEWDFKPDDGLKNQLFV